MKTTPRYGQGVLIFLAFALLEPCFEFLCLFCHNFVFYHFADLTFHSVSLPCFLVFTFGIFSQKAFDQYLLMLPCSSIMALFVTNFFLFARSSIIRFLGAGVLLWFVISVMLFAKSYNLMNWADPIVILSYLLSSLYWFCSLSLTWLVLRLARLL